MTEKSKPPVEERSHSVLFLVLCGILLLVVLWTIWDETIKRRPWKGYQKTFQRLEYDRAKAEYDRLKAAFDEEQTKLEETDYRASHRGLREALEEAKAELNGSEHEKALRQLNEAQIELDEVKLNLQFAKSERDAAYYALHKEAHHDSQENPDLRKALDKLQRTIEDLRAQVDARTEGRDRAKEAVQRLTEPVKDLEERIAGMTAPMEESLKRMREVQAKSLKIDQVVISEFDRGNFGDSVDRVDRCRTCHVAIDRDGFEELSHPYRTHPDRDRYFSNHSPDKVGCTPCHEGQGSALEVEAAHGYVEHWGYPLLKGTYVEASCGKCHPDRFEIPNTETLSTAKHMFTDAGCFGCHDVEGFYDLEKIGPDLNLLGRKVSPEWIYRWLKDPKGYLPNATMPDFRLSDEEAEAVTAYLVEISRQREYTPIKSSVQTGSSERGRWLVENIGCRACHIVGDDELTGSPRLKEGNNYGPALNRVGDKVGPDELFDWLKDPKRFRPKSRMPNMRLTDQEAMDIVAYLMTMKKEAPSDDPVELGDLSSKDKIEEGRRVIRTYGCFGCHNIVGMEEAPKVSVELSDFGNKGVEELFFGDAVAGGRVPEESWEAWVIEKLKDSRIYATEMVDQKMPDFAFSEEDAKLLSVLLKSFDQRSVHERYVERLTPDEVAVERGRLLLRRYDCRGCHSIEGKKGEIAAQIAETFRREGKTEEEASAFAPPPLEGEGEKVQPDWLFRFLMGPTPVRPWLRVRMPVFYISEEEGIAMEKYFSKRAKQEEFKYRYGEERAVPEDQLKIGRQIFDLLKCRSCHPSGEERLEVAAGSLAPDLSLGKRRLKPDWILRWLKDPQSIQRGTQMPTNWPRIRGKYYLPPSLKKILGGEVDRQVEAVRDYLLTLDE